MYVKLSSIFVLVGFFLLCSFFLPSESSASNFYVSKTGNNSGGTSWATAWNELNQINWTAVQPGDTIFLDGGSISCGHPTQSSPSRTEANRPGVSCGMMYQSTLTVGKSGTSGNPITITLSNEPGRNGAVVVFGGRSTFLPYCAQTGYAYQTAGVRLAGIDLGGKTNIVLDGSKWSGIIIYGHNSYGLGAGGSNSIIRNLEIYDNGRAEQSGGSWDPNQEGVSLSGANLTFERVIVHNNGQDEFQSGGGISNLKLLKSWLYNSRKKPNGEMWNECTHSDGIQLYGGREQSGVLIEHSVIGPGFNQALMLGGGGYPNEPWAVIHNATIRNTLLFGLVLPESANLQTNSNAVRASGWVIDHITSYRPSNGNNHNVQIEGNSHIVKDSIFYGRAMVFPQGLSTTPTGNCHSQTTSYFVNNGVPQNVNLSDTQWFANPSAFDFAIKSGAPCSDKGSSITSTNDLFATFPDGSGTAPTPTTGPSPTPTNSPTPSPSPVPGTSFEAEVGVITAPFTITNGSPSYLSQSIQTTDPAQGGKAVYTFAVPTTGNYTIRARLMAPSSASNSLFVNVDAEPTSPQMIWDIVPFTNGFEERTVSWRGLSTDLNIPEFAPKVFNLTAGTHTVIVRGREANVQLDTIRIEPHVLPTIEPLPGDANGDRKVDGVDYMTWLNNYDIDTGGGVSKGDFNADGKTDGVDYIVWLNNFGLAN